jgi:hypothetical protein
MRLLQAADKRGSCMRVIKNTVPEIFMPQRRLNAHRRASIRQKSRIDAAKWLADHMADDMIERIGFMQLSPARAFAIGFGGDRVAQSLAGAGCAVSAHDISDIDQEKPLVGGPYDLITSLATLDTLNDLPGALLHYRSALASGGIFMASLLGAGTLASLRSILMEADADRPAARIHPQIDNRAGTALLERAGFARQVVDSHTLQVRYSKFSALIADLRDQGLTNSMIDAPPMLGRDALARAEAAFGARKDANGKVTETFEILTLTAWAP